MVISDAQQDERNELRQRWGELEGSGSRGHQHNPQTATGVQSRRLQTVPKMRRRSVTLLIGFPRVADSLSSSVRQRQGWHKYHSHRNSGLDDPCDAWR
jgi:hypothetical protein